MLIFIQYYVTWTKKFYSDLKGEYIHNVIFRFKLLFFVLKCYFLF